MASVVDWIKRRSLDKASVVHSALGYLSPMQYEQRWYEAQQKNRGVKNYTVQGQGHARCARNGTPPFPPHSRRPLEYSPPGFCPSRSASKTARRFKRGSPRSIVSYSCAAQPIFGAFSNFGAHRTDLCVVGWNWADCFTKYEGRIGVTQLEN